MYTFLSMVLGFFVSDMMVLKEGEGGFAGVYQYQLSALICFVLTGWDSEHFMASWLGAVLHNLF